MQPLFIYAALGDTWSWWELCENCYAGGFKWFGVPKDGGLVAYSYNADFDGFAKLWKTTDGGLDWFVASFPGAQLFARDFAMSFERPWKHYVCGSGVRIAWWWDEVFQWGDPIFPPLQDGGHTGVETAAWAGERLFVSGIDGGDRLSVVMGSYPWEEWTILQDGLPIEPSPGPEMNDQKFKFVAAPHDPILFYAAWGQGLWMRDMRDVVQVREPEIARNALRLSRPVPNPNGGDVEILFRGPVGIEPVVQVVDIQGRVVANLVGMNEGRYVWNGMTDQGREAGSGAYFVRARAGAETTTRMLILAR